MFYSSFIQEDANLMMDWLLAIDNQDLVMDELSDLPWPSPYVAKLIEKEIKCEISQGIQSLKDNDIDDRLE